MVDEKKRELVDDPDAPPSEEERVASERLRDALADPSVPNADAELARALALAAAPRALDAKEHAAIVERALAEAKPDGRGGRIVRLVFGVTASGLALAAAVALFVGGARSRSAEAPSAAMAPAAAPAGAAPAAAQLVPARSTQALFDRPFEALSKGAASARIDRIAMAREADLRENRFAMWGVR